MASKRAHFTQFNDLIVAYEPLKIEYNDALDEYQSIYLSTWDLFMGRTNEIVVPEYPNVPMPTPLEYSGPILSIKEMTYNFGYGKLSAGSLSSELGGKSFGVYG